MQTDLKSVPGGLNEPSKNAAYTKLERLLDPVMKNEGPLGTRLMWCHITPAKAQALLELNHENNRPRVAPHIKRLTRSMVDGRWRWTGAPFRFDVNGRLVDGQHRLTGCADSGVTLRFQLVIVGMQDDAIRMLDIDGISRTAVDIVRIDTGKSIPAAVISAIAIEHANFNFHNKNSMGRPGHAEAAVESEFTDELIQLHKAGKSGGLGCPSGVLPAAIRCMRNDRSAALAFFSAALRNEHTIDGRHWECLRLLCNEIAGHRSTQGHAGMHSMAARCIKAWNAYRSGSDMRKLQYNGTMPVAM